MSIHSFSSSSSSSFFTSSSWQRVEKWGPAPLRILSFIHSLNNDSSDDGCPFQSFALSLSLFLFLSSMRVQRMHAAYYIHRCERKKPRTAWRRRSSIADVGLVRTSLLRAGWTRVKSFLFSRSKQSMSDFFFFSSILNKWHQQYSDKYIYINM